MPSAIDPTKPADGVPAAKSDLRANLALAKTELDHGGFAEDLTPSNYTAANSQVKSHLAGIDAALGTAVGAVSVENAGLQVVAAATTLNFVGAGVTAANVDGEAQITIPGAGSGVSTWTNVKTAFGAAGDGTTDDTTALQNAINSGLPLFFPPGVYKITSPLTYNASLTLKGSLGRAEGGLPPQKSVIDGFFANPLLHRQGIRVDHNNQVQPPQDGTGYGVGLVIQATDIVFQNKHPDGCCVQLYNVSAPSTFYRCHFEHYFRGLLSLQCFGVTVESCYFRGTDSAALLNAGRENDAIALFLGNHSTAIACDFQLCGTGIHASSAQSNIFSCRLEVCGVAIRIGGPTLNPEVFGQNWNWSRSSCVGISMEANEKGLWLYNLGNPCEVRDIGVHGTGNAPRGFTEYGVLIDTDGICRLANVLAGGSFDRGAIVSNGNVPLEFIDAFNDTTTRPGFGAISTPYTVSVPRPHPKYHLVAVALNPSLNDAQAYGMNTITAFSDLQLRGIKGLDIANANVLPNNLGRIESVSQGATTHSVAFAAAAGTALAQFNTVTAVSGSGMAPGTYHYATSLIGPRGETEVDLSAPGAGNLAYKSVAVGAGQIAQLTFFGVSNQPRLKRRIYRGTAVGRFDGFYEIPTSTTTFLDNGSGPAAAFVGVDEPPKAGLGRMIPAEHEIDANYAIVVTPSWNTTCWVTNKATTGFTINFGTPAPATATLQWLLFRS